jgi:hypothetical protein
MGTARYAFRVTGSASDVVLAALQEGLQAEVDSVSTAVQSWLPGTHRSQTPSRCPTAA